jgi:predicted anti-sigma-YlaC factor YlaD
VEEIKDNSVAYLLHIFFEDTMEFWASKVGTAENAQRRFQEEIDGYTKMTGRQMQIHVQMCEACHSMAATIACESRMRDFYIRRYEENFVPNDRFEGVVIDPRQAKRIAKVW